MKEHTVFEKKDYIVAGLHPLEKIIVAGDTSGHLSVIDFSNIDNVKILKTIEDVHTAAVTFIAFHPSGNHFVTAAQDNKVCYFSSEDFQFLGYLTRCDNLIDHLTFDSDGKYLVVSSRSEQLRIVEVGHLAYPITSEKQTPKQIVLNDSEGGVRCCAFDPSGEYLATLGHDNSVRIWEIKDFNKNNVKPVAIVPSALSVKIKFLWATSSAENLLPVRFTWTFSGEYLILPEMKNREGKLTFIKRGTWKIEDHLTIEGNLTKPYQVSLSPNGLYLLVVDEKNITIFDMSNEEKRDAQTKVILRQDKQSALLSGAEWHKNEDIILTTNIIGEIKTITHFLGDLPSSYKRSAVPWLLRDMTGLGDLSFDSIEGDDKQPATTTPADEDNDEDKSENKETKSDDDEEEEEAEEESDEEEENEEEPTEMKAALKKNVEVKKYPKRVSMDRVMNATAKLAEAAPQKLVQEPFQPSATPFTKDSRRFLAHNYIGLITATEKGSEINIEIEFHNSSKYRSERFIDKNRSTMGAISEYGVILANRTSCTLRLTNDISNINWRHNMNNNETIDAVAVGKDFVAIGTTTMIKAGDKSAEVHNVRIYSLAGLQRCNLSSPGKIIALCAKNEQLVIVYEDNGLYYNLKTFNGASARSLKHERLPITSQSTLQWIGFSHPTDIVATVDSVGLLRLLSADYQGWNIVLDLNTVPVKGDQKRHYFVSSITDEHVMCYIQGVPNPVPRPTLEAVPFSVPLTNLVSSDSEKIQQLEKQVFIKTSILNQKRRRKLNVSDNAETEVDKTTMLLFNSALNDRNQERCYELCQTLHRPKALDIAIEYASKVQLPSLVQRLRQLKSGNKVIIPNEHFYGKTESAIPAPIVENITNSNIVNTVNMKHIEQLQKQIELLTKQLQSVQEQVEKVVQSKQTTVIVEKAETEHIIARKGEQSPIITTSQETIQEEPAVIDKEYGEEEVVFENDNVAPKKQAIPAASLFSPKRPKKNNKVKVSPPKKVNPFLTTDVKAVIINPNANPAKNNTSVLDKLDQLSNSSTNESSTKKRKREEKENDSGAMNVDVEQPAQKKHANNERKHKTLTDFMTKKSVVVPQLTKGGLGAKALDALKKQADEETKETDDDDLPEVVIEI